MLLPAVPVLMIAASSNASVSSAMGCRPLAPAPAPPAAEPRLSLAALSLCALNLAIRLLTGCCGACHLPLVVAFSRHSWCPSSACSSGAILPHPKQKQWASFSTMAMSPGSHGAGAFAASALWLLFQCSANSSNPLNLSQQCGKGQETRGTLPLDPWDDLAEEALLAALAMLAALLTLSLLGLCLRLGWRNSPCGGTVGGRLLAPLGNMVSFHPEVVMLPCCGLASQVAEGLLNCCKCKRTVSEWTKVLQSLAEGVLSPARAVSWLKALMPLSTCLLLCARKLGALEVCRDVAAL